VPADVLLGRERLQRTQVIKQPDVLMLLHLFRDACPAAVREANFRYYEPRCAHGSSLSPAIHALLAARLGDLALALRHLRAAMDIDLAPGGTGAAGGVHLGALGGLWQAVVFGFGGLHFRGRAPALSARLPAHWRRLALQVAWRGRRYALAASPGGAALGGAGDDDAGPAPVRPRC
jgi:kojibiose phosphorylase